MTTRHWIERVRHELVRRTTTVTAVERMVRIHLESPELDGFTSLAPDDHLSMLFHASESAHEVIVDA